MPVQGGSPPQTEVTRIQAKSAMHFSCSTTTDQNRARFTQIDQRLTAETLRELVRGLMAQCTHGKAEAFVSKTPPIETRVD